jgi:hypothetical protein
VVRLSGVDDLAVRRGEVDDLTRIVTNHPCVMVRRNCCRISPVSTSRAAPSPITTCSRPDTMNSWCNARQRSVPTMGFTSVDHFHPGSITPRVIVVSPTDATVSSAFPTRRTSVACRAPWLRKALPNAASATGTRARQ